MRTPTWAWLMPSSPTWMTSSRSSSGSASTQARKRSRSSPRARRRLTPVTESDTCSRASGRAPAGRLPGPGAGGFRLSQGLEQRVLGHAKDPVAEGRRLRVEGVEAAQGAKPDLLDQVAGIEPAAQLGPDAQLGPGVQRRREPFVEGIEPRHVAGGGASHQTGSVLAARVVGRGSARAHGGPESIESSCGPRCASFGGGLGRALRLLERLPARPRAWRGVRGGRVRGALPGLWGGDSTGVRGAHGRQCRQRGQRAAADRALPSVARDRARRPGASSTWRRTRASNDGSRSSSCPPRACSSRRPSAAVCGARRRSSRASTTPGSVASSTRRSAATSPTSRCRSSRVSPWPLPSARPRSVAPHRLGRDCPSARPRGDELLRVLEFFEEVARALHAAHEAGVVHRDIKPGNLMVTPDGRGVWLDFGQALDTESASRALTMSGEVFGTPAYMSPEQVAGEAHRVDGRTDVWGPGRQPVRGLDPAAALPRREHPRPLDRRAGERAALGLRPAAGPAARRRRGIAHGPREGPHAALLERPRVRPGAATHPPFRADPRPAGGARASPATLGAALAAAVRRRQRRAPRADPGTPVDAVFAGARGAGPRLCDRPAPGGARHRLARGRSLGRARARHRGGRARAELSDAFGALCGSRALPPRARARRFWGEALSRHRRDRRRPTRGGGPVGWHGAPVRPRERRGGLALAGPRG